MAEKDLIEIAQEKSIVYKGNFLEYHKDQVLLPNGKSASREYLHHPGAVAAIPLLDNGEVVLVKQYRYPSSSVLLEIPAGKLEPGEDPLECIQRELCEEINCQASQITHLISMWTTPGFSDEIIHLYLATGLQPVTGQTDEDEFLEVVTLSKEQLLESLKSQQIIDGKTALAVALVEMRKLW